MVNWESAMRRLWIIFSQTATICLAVLFVVSTLKPEWLPTRTGLTLEGPRVAVLQQESAPQGAATGPRADSYYEAVRKAAPSVVNVFTSKEVKIPRNPLLNDPVLRRFFGDQLGSDTQRSSSLGSGVIVSSSGYILTNHHVVNAADEIEVGTPDGKKLLAKVVGSDPDSDIAVLRVEAQNLPAITFGSSENLRVGDIVLAIGNPLGIGQTVTAAPDLASIPSRISSRPTRRSTRAIPAAPCSMRAATSSASIPRSCRRTAARSASASPSRRPWRKRSWNRSSSRVP